MLSFDLGPDPLRRLPALAERLGVSEWDGDPHTLVLATRDAKKYCLFELINALLDRLDKSDQTKPNAA
jgi:hypothetical protein